MNSYQNNQIYIRGCGGGIFWWMKLPRKLLGSWTIIDDRFQSKRFQKYIYLFCKFLIFCGGFVTKCFRERGEVGIANKCGCNSFWILTWILSHFFKKNTELLFFTFFLDTNQKKCVNNIKIPKMDTIVSIFSLDQ